MKTLKTLMLSTALAVAVGAASLTPAAYAQLAPPQADAVAQVSFRGGMGGGFPRLICNANGAAQLQARLDQFATGLALTPEQTPLFDAYRTAALAAQTSFADACAKIQPPVAGTMPDVLTLLRNQQAIATAQLDATNAVLPPFEAFYNSLSDQQKAALSPQGRGRQGFGRDGDRGGYGGDRGGRDWGRGDNRGRDFDSDRGYRSDRRNGHDMRGGRFWGPYGMPQQVQPGTNAPVQPAQPQIAPPAPGATEPGTTAPENTAAPSR